MKKIIALLCFATFFTFQTVNAQFVKIQDKNSNNDITGTSHQIFFAGSQNNYDYSAKIKNITGASQDVVVRRIYEERLSGSYDYFCWDLCFDSTDALSGSITLAPGATDSTSFHVVYYPSGNNGTSRIRFRFYSDENASDSSSVILHFISSPAGLNDIANQKNSLINSVGPIPANEQISLNLNSLSKNLTIQLVDLTGKVISAEQVNKDGVHVMKTSGFAPGVYLIQVLENNAVLDQTKVVLK
jgi:hypothetical protein